MTRPLRLIGRVRHALRQLSDFASNPREQTVNWVVGPARRLIEQRARLLTDEMQALIEQRLFEERQVTEQRLSEERQVTEQRLSEERQVTEQRLHDLISAGPFDQRLDADGYRAALLTEIVTEHPDAREALGLIREAISALPDEDERRHAPLHEVRYLLTYAMAPSGPGLLIDVGASSIYTKPLTHMKKWDVRPLPILAIDYEQDRFPFGDETADGVLICEVIEHFVLDPLHCMIEINRILKPGGFVVVTTPNAISWFSIYQALAKQHPSRWPVYAWNRPNSRNHIHAREYAPSELRVLLESAGFGDVVITTRDYGISPPYRPAVGFDVTERGETIFCRAYKQGPPRRRSVTPLYLDDVDFPPPQLSRT